MSKPIHHILVAPLLTEKSVAGTQEKKYVFHVAMDANKIEIAKAVEEMFAKDKVKVASVNTLHMRGKSRRSFGRRRGAGTQSGQTPNWKKAVGNTGQRFAEHPDVGRGLIGKAGVLPQ